MSMTRIFLAVTGLLMLALLLAAYFVAPAPVAAQEEPGVKTPSCRYGDKVSCNRRGHGHA